MSRWRRWNARSRRLRDDRSGARGSPLLLGLPLPLLLGGLAVAALIGILLAYALSLTTQSAQGGALDSRGGNISEGLTVVTERTLGPEVQDLVDSGYIEASAGFDVGRCLRAQGIEEPTLIMKEVAWGPSMERSWLIVHTSASPRLVQTEGGAVSATVVTPDCSASSTAAASRSVLWRGSVLLKPSAS